MKKLFLICLALVFLLLSVSNISVYASVFQENSLKNASYSKLHQRIDPQFFERIKTSDETVSLIIELNEPCVVEAKNRNIFLKVIKPINEEYLKEKQESLFKSLKNSGLSFEIDYTFQNLINGFSIKVEGRDVEKLLERKEIKSIFENKEVEVNLTKAINIIQAPKVWNLNDQAGVPVTGKGIIVGIIDTGIDYTHPDLGGGFGPQYKVIGGYDFANNDNDPKDDHSHGTHVAGIVAANGRLKGVAPDAKLMAYKVFKVETVLGIFLSVYGKIEWIVAAMERSLKDKCDIVNLSLGLNDIWLNQESPIVKVANNLMQAGVIVVSAAGNSGARTIDLKSPVSGPAVAEKTISVGASDSMALKNYEIYFYSNEYILKKSIADSPESFYIKTLEEGSYKIADCGDGSKDSIINSDIAGKVAVIKKNSSLTKEEQNLVAKEKGGIGILYYGFYDFSFSKQEEEMLSSLFIYSDTVEFIKPYFDDGIRIEIKGNQKETITPFSSQGPILDINFKPSFKPDLIAPGMGINSTVLDSDYEQYPGTSMASPMVAGASALLKQMRPNLNIDEIKNLLIETADIITNPDSRFPISLTLQGSGRLNVYNAALSSAVISPPSFTFKGKENSNEFNFEIKNISSSDETYTLKGEMLTPYSEGVNFLFSSEEINLSPGEKKEFKTTVKNSESLSEGTHEGVIWLTNKSGSKLHIPFYFFKPDIYYPKTIDRLKLSLPYFSPNGDGVEDILKISFFVNKGTTWDFSGLNIKGLNTEEYNTLRFLEVKVLDSSGNSLSTLFSKETEAKYEFEQGFYNGPVTGCYEFILDGKNKGGRYFLTNGDYKILVRVISKIKVKISSSGFSLDFEPVYEDLSANFSVLGTLSTPQIEPPEILTSLSSCILKDKDFYISGFINNAIDIKSISFDIRFDPLMVSITKLSDGAFFSMDGYPGVSKKIDNTTGVANLTISKETTTAKGSGLIFRILLKGLQAGVTDILIENIIIKDSLNQEIKLEPKTFKVFIGEKAFPPVFQLNIQDETYTNKDEFLIEGSTFVGITVYINGVRCNVNGGGAFTFSITLKEGANEVTVVAKNCEGEVKKETKVIILDKTPPVLEINNLPLETKEKSFVISGVTEPFSTVEVLKEKTKASDTGAFSLTISLSKGLNNLTITSTDRAGNKTTVTRTITFKSSTIIKLTLGSTTIYVNDSPQVIDVAPIILEGRTLLPIRYIIEPLSGSIYWDSTDRKVTITLEGTTIDLWIGKSNATVNDVSKPIDPGNPKVVPVIISGRTMLPVRFVAENLGAKVDWDSVTKTVTITYPAP